MGTRKAAELAAPDLRREHEQANALEVRRGIERVLEKLKNGQSAHQLRSLRAVEVLEYMGPKSLVLLEKLASGAPEAMVTKRAKEALSRVSARVEQK
jgi:hypothetical protein